MYRCVQLCCVEDIGQRIVVGKCLKVGSIKIIVEFSVTDHFSVKDSNLCVR